MYLYVNTLNYYYPVCSYSLHIRKHDWFYGFPLSRAIFRTDVLFRDGGDVIEWAAVGLRVAVRDITLPVGQVLLPYVVSVQDKGPAFYAGVQPGDAVTFLGCGNWYHNFVDQRGSRWTYYQYHSASRHAGIPRGLKLPVQKFCRVGVSSTISVAVPQGDSRRLAKLVEMRTSGNNGGSWLVDKNAFGAGLQMARTDVNSRYQEMRQHALSELRKSPCSYDVSNPYDLEAMPPIIGEMVQLRTQLGLGEEFLPYWADVVRTYCDESRNGGPLPSFEVALIKISRGDLNPCAYDPHIDYSAAQENPNKLERRYSRTEYDTMVNFDYFLKRLATPAMQQCFFDLVRSRLTGKP